MQSKSKRDEVWKSYKPYMKTAKEKKSTFKDLIPICERCEDGCGDEHDYEECRGKQCMELFLSNAYLEWCKSWEGYDCWGGLQ